MMLLIENIAKYVSNKFFYFVKITQRSQGKPTALGFHSVACGLSETHGCTCRVSCVRRVSDSNLTLAAKRDHGHVLHSPLPVALRRVNSYTVGLHVSMLLTGRLWLVVNLKRRHRNIRNNWMNEIRVETSPILSIKLPVENDLNEDSNSIASVVLRDIYYFHTMSFSNACMVTDAI